MFNPNDEAALEDGDMVSISDPNLTFKQQMNENESEYEMDQEEVIKTILGIGNEIWRNFGQEGMIEDYTVFFQHQFYINCFQMAYPQIEFQGLLDDVEQDQTAEKMGECIQALIDLLSEEILLFDLSHISGQDIVQGNADHCINLLQILQQISQANLQQESEKEDKPKEIVDNLEDIAQEEPVQEDLSANKINEVIGQQLDIEFDDDIQDNLNDMDESESSKKKQYLDQEQDQVDQEQIEIDVDQQFQQEEEREEELEMDQGEEQEVNLDMMDPEFLQQMAEQYGLD